MVRNKETPKPTNFLKSINLENYGAVASRIGDFIDDMTNVGYRQIMKAYFFAGALKYIKNPSQILTSKIFQSFTRLILSPNLSSASNFLLSKNLLISCMHFQDAYNFNLDRVKNCIVHYGVIDPDDPSKVLQIPFCTMNTLHRERLELANAIKGEEAKKAEVIQTEIKELLETVKE